MKKRLAILLSACLALSAMFVGCGGSGSSESAGVAGTYELTGLYDSEGTEYTLAEYADANGVSEDDLSATYTLNDDGTGTMTTLGTETEISYEEDGTTVVMTINGQEFTYEYDEDAGTLVSVDSGTGYESIMTKK